MDVSAEGERDQMKRSFGEPLAQLIPEIGELAADPLHRKFMGKRDNRRGNRRILCALVDQTPDRLFVWNAQSRNRRRVAVSQVQRGYCRHRHVGIARLCVKALNARQIGSNEMVSIWNPSCLKQSDDRLLIFLPP
jgi:hypothetical protein